MSDQIIPITKQSGTTSTEQAKPSQVTETVQLPSKGHYYPENHPLASGVVQIHRVTAKHEDILSNASLLKKGTVLDEFLRVIIATPNVTIDDFLIGDKNALFVAARKSAYGEIYSTKVTCPACEAKSEVEINLDTIKHKTVEFLSKRGENRIPFKLPHSGRNVVFSLLTHRDDADIDQELKAVAKLTKASSPEITTRLKYSIKSIDGESDRFKVKAFVDEQLTARDSLALRNFIREITPDLDMTFDFTCEECGYTGKLPVPMGVNFFWPSLNDVG